MEREKMIEEMTTFLKCCNHLCSECERAKQLSSVYGCIEFSISKTLYNAGYRKVPEGAVVLTKEECEHKVILDEDHFERALNYEREKVRKETAKEILNMGKKLYEMAYHKSNAMPRLIEWIKVEYGVEIEE